MTNIPIKIQFVKSLPTAQPSRIVAVKADGDTAFSLWVTDKTGIPYPLKNLQNNVIITNTDGNLQITSSSTSTNINLASSILATINSALQSGDNISELVNNVGYLTTFTETDPVFQASEASLFVSGDKFNLDNQSGINSGDQDSIVGISGTKAQFNTELTDGDFLFEGDITQYTDELAQDAIGSILTDTATINFSYDDTTPTVSANVKLNSIDATHLADGINITEFTNNANYETTSQLNIRDTNNRNRVNHTGEQPISTVTGLQTNLDLKQDALGYTPENVANKATTLTASSTLYPNNDAVIAGLALKEDKVNKVTSISLSANDTNYPSELAVKTYADNLVVGMLNDRGTWDASGNVFPTTGGSGVGGAIRKGDIWYVSVAGTLGAKSVNVGDSFRALVNAPSQVAANWSILEANIGYVPANDSNVVHLAGAETITGQKTFSPTISASGAIARGTYLTPSLTATANNDVLVGLDIAPTFNNVAFTGVKNISARFNGLADVRASGVGSKFSFGDGSLYFGWNNGNYLDIISAGGLRVGNQGFIKLQLFSTTGSLILQNGGTFTDDGVNRLQVTGTVSSGTTALGNTPPIANNQLTRKDYVDSGLATKEPSFTKNTAFNKNFGTTAGTVVEGNYPPAKDGTGATGTWGINISGLAANSTLWNGYDISVAPTDAAPSGILGYYNSGVTFKRSSATALSSFLGLGSNAYTSTAYLPLTGGIINGSLTVQNSNYTTFSVKGTNTGNNGGGLIRFENQDTLFGEIAVETESAGNGVIYIRSLTNGAITQKASIASNGAATFSSTVTASPATLSNHVVVKSQLDAVVGNSTSGDFSTTVTNAVNVSGFLIDSATYTRIGNIINANVSMSLSSSTAGLSTFNLTLPFAKGNNSGAAVGSGSALTSITVFPVSVRSLNSTTAFVSVNTPSVSNMLVSVNFQYDVTK